MAEGYTVTRVRQASYRLQGGQTELRYIIHILTDKGATGSIEIRASEYSKEKVTELLDKLASDLDMPYEL